MIYSGKSKHWICTWCNGDEIVRIMDSLGSFMPLGLTTILQVANIYSVPPSRQYLRMKKLAVQQQAGVLDCGVFSIAFATEVCMGQSPEDAYFNQKLMRRHLRQCLVAGVMCPFPQGVQKSFELPRATSQILSVLVYCHCRMPDVFDSHMVSCDHCKRWYHFSCVGISKKAPKSWKCCSCI